MLSSGPFPLDEVLKSAAVDSTIKDAFNFPFFLVVNNDWVRQQRRVSSGNGVLWSWCEFDNVEYWVEVAHGSGKAEAVGIGIDLLVNNIWSKAVVSQLP